MADSKSIDRISEGQDCPDCDLTHADISYTSLAGRSLYYAWLSGASLNFANLRLTNLERVAARGASFKSASLIATKLDGADLTESKLDGAIIVSVKASGTNLERASFEAAVIRDCEFGGIGLKMAKLDFAVLQRTEFFGEIFKRPDLRGATFRGCHISESRFHDCMLDEVDFGTATSEFDSVATLDLVDISSSSCKRLRAPNVLFSNGSFVDSDLDEADFRDASLVNVRFQTVSAKDSVFEGATLQDCNIGAIDPWGASLPMDLSDANMSGAHFISGEMRAYMPRANLQGCVFLEVKMTEVEAEGSNLKEAIVVAVDLSGANLMGANLCDADLRGVLNPADATWTGAVYNSGTAWPPGFDPDAFGASRQC